MRHTTRYLSQVLLLAVLLLLTTVTVRWMLFYAPGASDALAFHPTATAIAPSPTASPTPTATATSAPTNTPTLPTTPTPTFTPTLIPPPPHVDATLVLTFTAIYTGPTPTAMPVVEMPGDVVNVLLLGADRDLSVSNWYLTDVIIIASIDPVGPSVNLISIPRDFYAWIPGHGYGKINTASAEGEKMHYPGGGLNLLKATIEYNLGIPIHYYALADYSGFVSIVDTLGGVDVPVECELHDTFPDPNNPLTGTMDIDVFPGVQHLDGYQALWFVRSRWSTHDFDRNRRQQQMLRALYRQTLSLDVIPRIPELWEAVQQTVRTDLGLSDVLYLGDVGRRLDWSNVKSRFVGPPYLTPTTAENGAYILVPVPGALEPLIAEALQPPADARANHPAFRVEVLDGIGRSGLLDVAVERLRWEGFAVVNAGPADQVYPRTQIVDMTTTSKGSPLWLLSRIYQRWSSDVIAQPTADSPIDFRIILGSDYNSCIPSGIIQYVPPPTPAPTPTP